MKIQPEFYILISTIIMSIIMYYAVKKKKGHIFDRFTDKISIISSIFIPVGIFLTLKIFTLQYDEMVRNSTYKIIDRGWVGVNEKLMLHYDECPNFINSLYFDWQKKTLGIENKYDTNEDKWQTVNYLSILIFQAWEDFLTSVTIDSTGEVVWLNNFLQWSNSKLLRNNWNVLKGNFSYTTQEFGDYLFYMSSVYKPKTNSELNHLAKMMSQSDNLKNIINNRHA